MATLKFDEQPDVFIGVKLPITNGGQGYFNSSLTTLDQVKSNLKNLILTIKGERLMHPDFGTNINAMLFEPDDGTLKDRMAESIIQAVNKWLPYIVVKNIEVNEEADELNIHLPHQHVYSIICDFALKQDPTIFDSITLTVSNN
tara:strand:+ start:86 stop:517 length:432 start_codon:yes stop_codon:yes gene_type:complete